MKFIIQLVAIVIAAFTFELFMPWWGIAVGAFLCGYLLKSKANFIAGLFAISILWGIKAWMIDASAAVPLAERVASIFSLSKTYLMVVTALIGGLVGGLAAVAGASLKKEKKRYY